MAADLCDPCTLPFECLQHIYSFLDLRERARGALVCRHWAAALASGAVELLEHRREDPPEMWEWLLRRELAPTTLRVEYIRRSNDSCRALLEHTVKHAKVLDCASIYLDDALPAPHLVAPRLQKLNAGYRSAWSTGWGAALAQLPQLQHLVLHLEPQHDGQELALPALPGLTSLELHVSFKRITGPEITTLYFSTCTLGPLPSIRRLEVQTRTFEHHHPRACSVDLRPAGHLPLLEELQLIVRNAPAALDFHRLPAVRTARLWAPRELAGADTIGAAHSLEVLCLGDDDGEVDGIILERPWVIALLRELPCSVWGLSLRGRWGTGMATALGAVTQLQVLGVVERLVDWSSFPGDETEPDGPRVEYPPATAPLWGSLRALDWFNDDYDRRPPQELRGATGLELLQVCSVVNPGEARQICSTMPALRQLYVPDLKLRKAEDRRDMKHNRRKREKLANMRAALPTGVVVIADFLQKKSNTNWTEKFLLEARALLEAC